MQPRTRSAPLATLAMVIAFTIGLVAIAAILAMPARAATITGVVRDRDGKPVEYANVAVPVARIGTVTDSDGRFTLDVPDGPALLEITQIGYEKAKRALVVSPALAALAITLSQAPVPVAEVVVAASSFGKVGKSEGATLRRLDVVTTPGGMADVFQALRALPSINAPDEGAALYVRGGDPKETLIRLDGGEIGHPYHYEGASGGLFSAFDAYMLKSAFFSSGGFSAKYGGVLSGVLDIETQDPMNLRTISVGANIVGGGVSGSWALIPDRLAIVGTVRATDVRLLNRLYPASDTYVQAPASGDGAGRLLYRYSPTGRLALLYLGSGDRISVVSQRLNFEGTFSQRSRNQLAALQFQDAIAGRLALKGQISVQRYRTHWTFGPSNVENREAHAQASLDAVWDASARHELSFGANGRRRTDDLSGAFPADSTDYAGGAPVRFHNTRPTLEVPGFYVEDKARVWGPLYATFGARADYVSLANVWTSDPRAALAWRLGDHQTLRVATGRYHQPADAAYLDPVYGNPQLRPLTAEHVIAGYEWATPELNVRLEGYRKDYRDLITQSATTFYSNEGHGYARGIDLFVRGRRGPLAGWVSYGYQDSRRKEGNQSHEVPSRYGVPHSVTVVAAYQLPSLWQLGARMGYSSGRAYTPVVGATYDPVRDTWHPIEGEQNSARLPDYRRLDVRVMRLFSLPELGGVPPSSTCVFYVEAMNVFGSANVLDYVYNADYSQRRENLSYFSRHIVVVGFGLTW